MKHSQDEIWGLWLGLAFVALLVVVAILIAGTSCAPVKQIAPRTPPVVTWFDDGPQLDEQSAADRHILAYVDPDITTLQIWRLEWSPVGDSCWTPISYAMIAPHEKRHILWFRATNTQPGDRFLIWRSHPWPDELPEGCFVPVRAVP